MYTTSPQIGVDATLVGYTPMWEGVIYNLLHKIFFQNFAPTILMIIKKKIDYKKHLTMTEL
jgi:hypothetical protein